MIVRSIRESSVATLAGLLVHYIAAYVLHLPRITEQIAEWLMARTPNALALTILDALGEWAKPWAVTGGLASLGFLLFVLHSIESRIEHPVLRHMPSLLLLAAVPFTANEAAFLFWIAALGVLALFLTRTPKPAPSPQRRKFLAQATEFAAPLVLAGGTAAVAVESWARDRALARKAVEPIPLWLFRYPEKCESFAPGLVRKCITDVDAFYGMSKNAVDPSVDPSQWRLKITVDERPLRDISYQELLALPRVQRITTMRCVSNTLQSNLMGTAEWSGIFLRQLVDPEKLPSDLIEVAFIGVEGHDDSIPLSYALSYEILLGLGMNGKTLNRVHGFPVRLVAPKYYGFKSVKWLGEIRFVSKPYFGTWPKMGYTKEPLVHTMSFIDRIRRQGDRIEAGGVAFAGIRGIRRVEIRADGGPWTAVSLEEPLSRYTLTRWKGELVAADAKVLEARALDGDGRWQAVEEKPIFPDGVAGPTLKRL